MDCDVSGLSGDDALPCPHYCGNDCRVCLGTADQKTDVRFWACAGSPYFCTRAFAVCVFTVSGCFFHIRFSKALQNTGMCSFHILAFEMKNSCHGKQYTEE